MKTAPLPPRPTTALIGRVLPPTTPGHPAGGGRRLLCRTRRAAALVVLGGLTLGVIVLSNPTGSVAHADGVCIDTSESNTWGPDGVRTGVDGMIEQTGPNGEFGDPLPGNYKTIDEAINDTSHTDYEKLGTAGTLFSVDYGSQDSDDNACFPVAKVVGNFLANSVFNVDKVFARLAISTYQWATNPGILAPLNEPLDEVTQTFWNGMIKYLLGAVILIGVATVVWLMLVKRRFSLGFGGIIWMVFAVAALMLFVVKPSWIASKIDESVSSMTNLTFTSGATHTESVDPHVAATYTQIRTQPNAGQRIASDMMWRVMIYQPWLSGQWGNASSAPVLMATDPYPADTPEGWYNGTRDAHYQQLYSQACVLDPAVSICDQRDDVPNAPGILDTSVLQGQFVNQYAMDWYMVQNWTCTSADYCIGPVGNPDNGDDDDEREVAVSNGWQYRAIWSGDQPEQRMLASITGLVASLALGGIIFLLAAVVICYDLVMYMLLFLAPFMLLLGIQPTWGRRIAEGFGTQLLQIGLKRIMAGILVALLIVIYGVIMGTNLGWAQQVGLMLGIGVAVVLLRRPLMDTVGVIRMGQGSTALEGVEDAATDKATKKAQQGTAVARKHGTSAAKAAGTAPGNTRRAVIGGRRGAEVARERARMLTEQGTGLTAGQQRRTRFAAAFAGAKAGASGDNRYDTEKKAAAGAGAVVAARGTAYTRQADRKFARTEQGKAQELARTARATERGDAAKAKRLQDRDADVRVAAVAKPKRFTGTPQNFDGYEGSQAMYVDRNTRRPVGPTQGKHYERADGAPLHGADPLPDIAEAAPAAPHHKAAPLRGAAAWRPDENSAAGGRSGNQPPTVSPRVIPRIRPSADRPRPSSAAPQPKRIRVGGSRSSRNSEET